MKNLLDNRGYALLIVLMLIVLITTISAVFMRGAISNTKQEKLVDDNHLSVVAAEMGVDYFTATYTNAYFEIKDALWETQVKKFRETISKPGFNGDLTTVGDRYQSELRTQLLTAFTQIDVKKLPSDVRFSLLQDKMGMTGSNGSTVDTIHLDGSVLGKYSDGKTSTLVMKLEFQVPSVLNNGGVIEPEEPSDTEVPEFEILEPQRVDNITINSEINTVTGSGNTKKKTVRSAGKIDLEGLSSYKGGLSLHSREEVQAGHITGNGGVEILSNKEIQTNTIENNGNLSLISKGKIQTENILNNKNVLLRTNEKIDIQGILGYSKYESTIETLSYSLESGKDISLKGLQFAKSTNIIAKEKISIEDTGLLNNNETKISTKDEFQAGPVLRNNNLEIYSLKKYQSNRLEGNNNVTIKAGGKIQIDGVVQNNNNVVIESLGKQKIHIQENMMANNNMTIISKGDFQAAKISGNNNLKITAHKKFQADSVDLIGNSRICVWGKFDVDSKKVKIDNTSRIYLRGNQKSEVQNLVYLNNEDWKNTCGVNADLPDEEEEEESSVTDYGWEPPSIDVTYK